MTIVFEDATPPLMHDGPGQGLCELEYDCVRQARPRGRHELHGVVKTSDGLNVGLQICEDILVGERKGMWKSRISFRMQLS